MAEKAKKKRPNRFVVLEKKTLGLYLFASIRAVSENFPQYTEHMLYENFSRKKQESLDNEEHRIIKCQTIFPSKQ